MRYVVASLIACLIVSAGTLFVWQTRSRLQGRFEEFKNDLKAKKEAGQLPPEWQGVDLDQLELSQVGITLPHSEQTRLGIANLLSTFWYLLVPLAFIVCLGVAALLGKLWGLHA